MSSLIAFWEDQSNRESYQVNTNEKDTYNLKCFADIKRFFLALLAWPFIWLTGWWKTGKNDRRTANATALLAVGTLILAGVNVFMLDEMKRGEETTKRIAVATESATRNNAAAIEVLQRPFVSLLTIHGVTDIQQAPDGTFRRIARVFPVYKNFGASPTLGMFVWSHELSDAPDSGSLDFNLPIDAKPEYMFLAPQAEALGRESVVPNVAVKKRRYLWGILSYRDRVYPDIPHETRYCWVLEEMIGDPNIEKQTAMVGHACAGALANCADEECPDYPGPFASFGAPKPSATKK